MSKLEERIKEILKELLQWYEQIDGNVLDSVPNAFQNVTDEIGEKMVKLFKQWALELLPETINEKFLDTPKERGYILGWNRCLKEIRKRIEEE